jgi:hypothetical protein
MALLLMRHTVAGILVGLGTVAARVGRRPLVHVHVAHEDGLLRESFAAQLAAVGQLVPGRVRAQYMTCVCTVYR